MGQLYKSKRGRELIKELKQSDKIFYIVSSPGSRQLRRIGETTIVQIDPNYHPDLCTTQGILPIETSIAIAHEMGHLIGAHDDGPGSMANILKNENPVRRDLGIPLRTQYDLPPCKKK
jgi:hypothetical protein